MTTNRLRLDHPPPWLESVHKCSAVRKVSSDSLGKASVPIVTPHTVCGQGSHRPRRCPQPGCGHTRAMRPPAALRVGDAFCATTSALRVIENVIRTDKDPEKRELIVLKLRALLHEATTSDAAVQATRPAMWEHADVDTPLCMKEPPGPLPSLCQLYNGEHQAPPWISSARCTCLSCGQPATCTDKRCTSERGFSMVLGEDPMRKLETGFLEARRVQRARFRTRLRLLRCRIFLSRHDSIRHRLEYERHRLELAELRERMCALADKLSRQLPPPPPAPHTAIAEATAPKSLGKLGFSSYLQSIGTKRKGKQLLRPIETPDTANMLNESTVGALRRATLSHGNLDLSITQPARTGSAAMSAQSDVACDTASNTSDSCPGPRRQHAPCASAFASEPHRHGPHSCWVRAGHACRAREVPARSREHTQEDGVQHSPRAARRVGQGAGAQTHREQ